MKKTSPIAVFIVLLILLYLMATNKLFYLTQIILSPVDSFKQNKVKPIVK